MQRRSLSACIYTAIITCCLLGSSCTKVLEQTPRNSTYLEQFWKNARDCRSALAGNYALLRTAATDKNNRYYMYGDAIAKNYFVIDYTGDALETIQNGDFTFQYNVNSLGNWTLYFKVITMSNTILKQVPLIPDAAIAKTEADPVKFKNQIIGQAYFLRALSYFMMTRVWGDVPLVTIAYDDPIAAPQLPRSPRAEVLKQIEKDCHAAAALLNWGYTNASEAAVTANKGSVYALLAHMYLWRATTTNPSSSVPILSDVDNADTTIKVLVNNGGYRLTDTSKYYDTFVGHSAESIFELNMSEDTQEGSAGHIGLSFLRGSDYVAYFGDRARFAVAGSYFSNNYGFKPGDNMPEVRDTNDVRFRKGFDYVKQDRPMCRKYSNVVYRNPGTKRDAYLSNNMIIFRLSDMLLLQAEIAIYKNDLPTATGIINNFRQRNGSNVNNQLKNDLTADKLMREYVKERGKELYLEGHIYYDLIRTRMAPSFVDWLTEDRFSKEGYYWPVDPALFRDNKFLVQTTYWLGKV